MSCALCSARNGRKNHNQTGLCLLPANEDMALLLAAVLAEHRIPFERHRNLFGLRNSEGKSGGRVVALLRQVLSEPERLAVMVVHDSPEANPSDFPRPQPLEDWWRARQTDWFSVALAEDKFEIWYQPIVDPGADLAATPRLLAHECLIRLKSGRLYGGAEIVEAARVRNEIHVFDSYARDLAIRSAALQSKQGKYFVNFMPSSIYNPELCLRSTLAALEKSGMGPENIVFEVVESDHGQDPSHLRRICDYYRSLGFGVALDDMGTGTNSLQLMCDLRPDYIKLDRSLISNVEQPVYAATIRKMVEVAAQFSTVVIAEGVEREETMENLWLLGVQWMQGYLFGRPAPQPCGARLPSRVRPRSRQQRGVRATPEPVTLAH
jgi:EAL domain-containing protein (putative c-di-GMP-specific phosphodiesterase class I)